jgi:hypothetical protein
MMQVIWPWLTLALLGAYHGLNPGMGWLFAVALGLQERSRAAVIGAFAPIALGHALSIAGVVAVVSLAQTVVTPDFLRLAGAVALVVFGLYKLVRAAHPRWVGMRVNFRDLTAWSFLMATAHGAGLMLVPILLQLSPGAVAPSDHAHHVMAAGETATAPAALPIAAFGAVGIHTAAMFLVMGLIAVVVYEKLGLAILRQAWLNLDRIWAVALIGVGILTFVV